MPENILVVEYEPRYTDRVKQALNGQPFQPLFAKDGEEALTSLDQGTPRLIVLSSVIPKISAPELIRKIRGRADFKSTPILMTISGYSGKSPRADAMKLGASDILPKPYSEGEFLGKVRQLLSAQPETTVAMNLAELGVVSAKPVAAPAPDGATLTSSEIFGDLVDDEKPVAKKTTSSQDLDDMLAQTLSGVRPVKKKPTEERPAPQPAATASAKAKASQDLDELLHNTLSGLEKKARPATQVPPPKPVTPPQPVSQPVEPPAAAPAKPAPAAEVVAKPVEPPSPVIPPIAPAPAPEPVVAKPAPPVVPPPMAPTVGVSAPVVASKAEAEHKEEEEDHGEGIRFGQYVLLEKIATGGMAEVWKARMRGVEGFQKIVAIKKILPHMSDNEEFVTMFIDEAKLAAQLNHNNIIHIYDLGKIANSYYIAMEFIDGRDLKTILKRGEEQMQPLTVELALFIASKIASALDYAHRKRDFDEKEMGLVHRDVSPQNVLISYEGDIKLCDFGIAKAASKASHTMAGALKGKLQYMSPEQAWGKPIDKRSDIFALAAVLFEMLTGRKLFAGDSELSILDQVREARVQVPSQFNDEVTPEIDRIMQKALQKEPSARYQTAGELARDLDAVLYSFRPTPTSADLAIFMHRLYSGGEEPVIEAAAESQAIEAPAPAPVVEKPAPVVEKPAPAVVTPAPAPAPVAVAPVIAPVAEPQVAPVAPSFGAPAEEPKKLPIVPIAIAAVVLIAAIGGFFFMRKGSAPSSQPAATSTQVASTTAPASAQPATPTQSALPTATTATGLAQNDEALVNEEVKRRLAEEKARLDQQRAAQATPAPAAATPTATTAPAPQPAAPQPAPVQPAPAPVQPTATVAEQREEPKQTAPAPAPAPVQRQVREGDLVDPGTEGLQPPQLVSLKKPQYPAAARAQRVEGIVVVRALVSETGRVLDVTVLRGVAQKVGINEAAAEALRMSTFRPATKDGVRVKSYYTMTMPFKL